MPRAARVTMATLPSKRYRSASFVDGGVIASSVISFSLEVGLTLLDEGARPFLGIFRRQDRPANLQLALQGLSLGQPLGLDDAALDGRHRQRPVGRALIGALLRLLARRSVAHDAAPG